MSMIFGPVPSRRLGRSLGINNIPPKECSYTCVYCQLGNTIKLKTQRQKFYTPEKLVEEVSKHLERLNNSENQIDYITFVPDGEPTLDANLGESIISLRQFGIKIAVITNSSLIDDASVRDELKLADWVSLKIDTVNEETWHKIDRPHRKLNFNSILEGIKKFSLEFENFLATETMLIKNINDNDEELKYLSEFISVIKSNKSYISIPTRPPAENYALPPSVETINKAYQIFQLKKINSELIIGYEGNEFSSTGNFHDDILNITSVHPMKHEAVLELLKKDNSKLSELDQLIESGDLKKIVYNNTTFYLRNLRKFRREKKF